MKITVLGRGNAGCLTALHYQYYSQFLKNKKLEIELIHDSSIPPIKVGQATTLETPLLLWAACGATYYNNPDSLKSTLKTGILYENWGKKDVHFHEFPFNSYAVHYDTKGFQDYILKNAKFKIKIIDKNIKDYSGLDSDYVFDCRGWPKNKKEYNRLINPLNSVITASLPKTNNDPAWTRCIATKNGWCFYIPLYNSISIGYLYNSNITKKEDALDDFKSMFPFEKINESFSFENYIVKQPIQDDRIIFNGNRLFFLEPLEATAVSTYLQWSRYVWNWIISNQCNSEQASEKIVDHIKKIELFILWHYASGSKFKTPFWEYAKDLALSNLKCEKFNKIVEEVKTKDISMLRNDDSFQYAQWRKWNFKNWLDVNE
jgi:hypothetical protein